MTNKQNADNIPQQTYIFLDYEVNPSLREIHQVKAPIKISKKSFDILILLIENQGRVVTKQELIDRVWPNQIVTDAALNKQITRLRSDLLADKSSEQAIIETVRGIGVKLIPTVQSKPTKTPAKESKTKVAFWVFSVLAIFALYFVIDFFSQKPVTEKAVAAKPIKQAKPLKIVLMPSENLDDWLNVGGLNYLSEQLQTHPEIQTINPRTEWFKNDKIQAITIEMSQIDQVDYVLSANLIKTDQQYAANIVLRKQQGVLARTSIQATSTSGLFEKMDSWVIRQLKISTKTKEGQLYGYQPTAFALESYLRALELSKNNSYEKSAQLLKTAVDEDSHFFSAWLLLIEVELQLGNYNKAQALITTLEQRDDYDKRLLNDLLNAKALTLVYLNQLDEATIALDKSITLSKEKNDVHAIIKSLITKAMIDSNSNNIGEHTVTALKERTELIKEYDPDPYKIAVSSLNLASIYQAIGQPESAIKHVVVAIEIFKKENNSIGIASSTSILARIYNESANPGKSLLVLESSDKHFDTIDAYSVQMRYLNNKIEAQLYFGLRHEAEANIQRFMELSLTNSGNEAKVIALILHVDLDILYQEYESAKPRIQQLLEIVKTEPSSYPPVYSDMIVIYDITVSALTEKPDIARLKMNGYLTTNPVLATSYAKELDTVEAILLNKEGFNTQAAKTYYQVMQDYIKVNHVRYALNAGYKILDIQWQNNRQDYVKTMNFLDEMAVFKYPIHKYKAQYLADKNEYANAYVMMEDLKSKANQFWTTTDQLLLENYQTLASKRTTE